MECVQLEAIARRVVASCLDRLPDVVAAQARRVPVLLRDVSRCSDHPDSASDERLGLFSGLTYGEGEPRTPDEMPRITLFLNTLWEESGSDPQSFAEEVETTFLHELGHYLGWDEDDLAERGLD